MTRKPILVLFTNNKAKKTAFKYLLRIVLAILFFHFYKNYDETLSEGFFNYNKRTLGFCVCFICFFLLVWEIGELIFNFIENYYQNKSKFKTKALFLILSFCIYGIFVTLLFSSTYYLVDILILKSRSEWDGPPFLHFNMNFGVFAFYLIIITVLGYLYNYKHWNQERINTEQLRRENIQSKYEALKNQIDPHFFFNSLTTLASLNIQKEHELSVKYINQLSKMYRYILDKDKKSLVTIGEEMKLLESYIYLIKVRHKGFISFDINLSNETLEQVFMPPITLQLLVENAIKHNKFSKDSPLYVCISEEEKNIKVRNNLSKRILVERSSEIGLQNIRKRYELLVNKSISVKESNSEFIVELPKLYKQHFESTNNYTT